MFDNISTDVPPPIISIMQKTFPISRLSAAVIRQQQRNSSRIPYHKIKTAGQMKFQSTVSTYCTIL